ncbi:MAG TPA: hypothetical protein VNT75_19595 [Symbiobacteriaceae bacterium]|nr:hypothetical protein [Symbiobacteriaceae bacterium]
MTRPVILIVLAAVLTGAAAYYWFVPREATASDGVVELSAKAERQSVTVTAKNVSAETILIDHCTHHMWLGGGVMQPQYKPCQPKTVALDPGQSVTDRIPVEQWLPGQEVFSGIKYQVGGEPKTLRVPVPHPH